MRKLALAVCMVLLASCGGPRTPLDVGAKEFPANILLGKRAADIALPPPPARSNTDLSFFPGFLQPPIPRAQPGEVPPVDAVSDCPVADPNGPSDLAAFNRAPKPPVPATYVYRNSGGFEIAGGEKGPYPPSSTRTVKNVRMLGAEEYEYDLEIFEGGRTTTTTYRVISTPSNPRRGIYLVQVVAPGSRGTDHFRPDPPILLMPFPPPEFGTNLEDETSQSTQGQYRTSGTDPLTQTTMVLEARISPESPKLRADACGEWVDGWDIEVTFGRIVSNGIQGVKDISFTGHFSLATQYGGLVVRDQIVMSGRDGVDEITSAKISTINSVPLAPK